MGAGGAGQVVQVVAFGLGELKSAGKSVQHALGDAGQVAAFELVVVVDAHPSQQGHLLAAQPGDPPAAAVHRQARLLGSDAGPAGGQELTDLAAIGHTPMVGTPSARLGGSASTWSGSTWGSRDSPGGVAVG